MNERRYYCAFDKDGARLVHIGLRELYEMPYKFCKVENVVEYKTIFVNGVFIELKEEKEVPVFYILVKSICDFYNVNIPKTKFEDMNFKISDFFDISE